MRRAAAVLGLLAAAGAASPYPAVRPGIVLRFPADHGAHPAFRTEWWYVTGWLRTAAGRELGFQLTFFRVAPPPGAPNPSRFAPTQLLFAHAALSDPAIGRLLHGERAARAGFGLAGAATGDTDVRIRDWRLRRLADGRFVTRIDAGGFLLDLAFRPTQPPLAEGDAGYSRKGRGRSRRATTTRSRTSPCPVRWGAAAGRTPSRARRGSIASGRPTIWRRVPSAGTGPA